VAGRTTLVHPSSKPDIGNDLIRICAIFIPEEIVFYYKPLKLSGFNLISPPMADSRIFNNATLSFGNVPSNAR